MCVSIFNLQPRIRNDPNSPSLSQLVDFWTSDDLLTMSHVVDMSLLFSDVLRVSASDLPGASNLFDRRLGAFFSAWNSNPQGPVSTTPLPQ